MKLYLIGGLGADERVFDYLELSYPTQVIHWIEPKKNETIESYCQRLKEQIDTTKDFGLLGVSFGGLVAIELAKIKKPEILCLISSIKSSDQLTTKYITIGKSGILNLVPNFLIKPPRFLLKYLFGAKNLQLLKEIIKDTDPKFIKWALKIMIKWKSKQIMVPTIRIHGTNDKLIPLKGNALTIDKGGHFMIVDNAKEISNLVNKELDKFKK